MDYFLIQFAWDQRPVFHDTKLGLLYLVPFVDLESHERDCNEKKAGPTTKPTICPIVKMTGPANEGMVAAVASDAVVLLKSR